MFYHGIVMFQYLWYRVITTVAAASRGEQKVEELNNGPYSFAFLDHFFPGKYRVEVRKVNEKNRSGMERSTPLTVQDPLVGNEAIRFSNASDQFRVLIDGHTGWLAAFAAVGLVVGNSKKMAKRLVEIVRATSMWSFRLANVALTVDVIDHKALGLRDGDVDGISAISRSLAVECVSNNRRAGARWRKRMIAKIHSGELTVVSFRAITSLGLIKGNALILPDKLMRGYNVRTFEPNIKAELKANGWSWVTLDTTYGINPTKSDDMSTAIFHQVEGMYDKVTLVEALKSFLAHSFNEMKAGKTTEAMTRIAESDNLHKESEEKFRTGMGRAARIGQAVADLASVGVPITASQTFMFMFVNGLRNQLLSTQKTINEITGEQEQKYPAGSCWMDKSRHWFPVPYAFTTHIMTREALQAFGFKMPEHNNAFVHPETHTFVVTGEYFALHYANHGGFDLDDGIKVHLRRVRLSDGSVELMGILVRDPVDFGEWSMTTVDPSVLDYAYHKYADEAPLVDYVDLTTKVPQFTTLRNQIQIGSLPFVTNPTQIGNQYSLVDEERVRMLSQAFPAGTGGTVTPKMIWYALVKTWISSLPASNEDLIDVLQQGLGTHADVDIIRQWSGDMFSELGNRFDWVMDPFWYWTRLPSIYRSENGGPWTAGDVSDSWWVQLHKERELIVTDYLSAMRTWLNAHIEIPEALPAIGFTAEELAEGKELVMALESMRLEDKKTWVSRCVAKLKESDEDPQRGQIATDRRILLLAYCSLLLKVSVPKLNWDQWLYAIDPDEEYHPYDWFVRAMRRLQDGTYDWVTSEYGFMDDELVNQIRAEFKKAESNLTEDQKETLIHSMRGHISGRRRVNVKWGQRVLAKLNELNP